MAKVEKISFKQPPAISNKDIAGIKKISHGAVDCCPGPKAKITNKTGSANPK